MDTTFNMDTLILYLVFLGNEAISSFGIVCMLSPKTGRKRTWLIMMGVLAAALGLGLPILETSFFRGIIILSALFICAFSLFKDKIPYKIGAVCLMLLLSVIAEFVTWILISMQTGAADINASYLAVGAAPGNHLFTARFAFVCIYFLLVILAVAIWKRNIHSLREKSHYALFTYIVLQLFTVDLYLLYIFDSAYVFNLALGIGMLIINLSGILLLIFFTRFLRRQAEIEAQAHVIEAELATQSRYFDTLSTQLDSIRKTRHDMNNHMTVVTALLNEGRISELKSYMEQLTESLRFNTKNEYSGNLLIDSVLSSKALAMQAAGIAFSFDYIDKTEPLDEFDFCGLVSNVIDFALSENTDEKASRTISMRYCNDDQFDFTCSFPYSEGEETKTALVPLRSSLEKLAERYGGKLEINGNTSAGTIEIKLQISLASK